LRNGTNNPDQAIDLAASVIQARNKFPTGLAQAEDCLRFDLSALLLGQYVAQTNPAKGAAVVDLGTGCGAAACQLLLMRQDLTVLGLEIIPEQAECARQNAQLLGQENFQVITGDLGDPASLRHLRRHSGSGQQQQFPVVLCNPPWLSEADGRPSPTPNKNLACRGDDSSIVAFFKAAENLLCRGGSLCCIVAAERLAHALHSLPERLNPVSLRLVHRNPDQQASFALFQAIKRKRAAFVIERPWFLAD